MGKTRNVRRKINKDGKGKVVSTCEVDWTDLPDYTIIRLFSCLNNRDRASLSSTCKPWFVFSKSPFLRQSLDLRLYKCNIQAAKSLASRCNDLRKLRIRGNDAAASIINLKANGLREISIDGCEEITDLTLSVLVARHEALECLQIGPDFCKNISSAGIKVIALCCPNLKKLRIYGVKAVSGEAIDALAENCQNLTDIGFIDCGKVDEAALGNVRTLAFLSVAGTKDINWNLALLHWSNLSNLVCLDVSRTNIEASAVSELLLSCLSLKVLCALECVVLGHNSSSINRRDKTLLAFFTDILKELACLLIDLPEEKENVFLDRGSLNNFKDSKLEGILKWVELTVCDSLLRVLINCTPGQGTILSLGFLQSSREEVKERAASAVAAFSITENENEDIDYEEKEVFVREGGIHFLVNLACSWQEVVQLESVKDEGGIDVLIKIARSPRETMATEALAALWNISSCDEHRVAIAEAGGLHVVLDIIGKCSKSNGGEPLMVRAVGALANFMLDEECCMEVSLVDVAPTLVKLLRTGMWPGMQSEASRCLANMAIHDSYNGAVGQVAGALEALVQLVRSHSIVARDEAARALLNLSSINERNREAIAAVGGVHALVALANTCVNATRLRLPEMAAGALRGLSFSVENWLKSSTV